MGSTLRVSSSAVLRTSVHASSSSLTQSVDGLDKGDSRAFVLLP
jgi:hypothetical protein